jgi:septal ring factor EnvC (AmiA/AmiB activator)
MSPSKAKILSLLILIALGISPTLVWAKKKPNNKKICKEAREQVAAIEKELNEIKEKKAQIEQEIGPIKTEFWAEQDKLRGMPRCSQGNPKNPPPCEAQLAKVRELGSKVRTTNTLNPLTPRRVNWKMRFINRRMN